MSWLVVGGNGQLGKALSFVLAERKIDFIAWGSKDLDIRSANLCNKYIEGLVPSVIINATGWTDVDGAEVDPEGAYAVNVSGALNLAVAAKRVKAVLAHVSTDYVFSGFSDSPWRECDSHAPVSVYGKTKAKGEVAVLGEYSEGSYIFRTAWLYSQWGKNFAKTLTRLALMSDGEVRVVDDQIGQPTSALDLANQIVDSVFARLPFGVYHATNSGQGTWFDFAYEIFSYLGTRTSVDRLVRIDSLDINRPANRPAYSVLGHGSWQSVGRSGVVVPEMRDWRIALDIAMPVILSSVERGE
jgi:dTDP-4-dehydrorhamnose reductase